MRSPLASYTPYPDRDADWQFGDMVARGNGIRITCRSETGCEHQATISGDKLLAFGPERTIADIFDRLVCSACRSRRVRAYVVGVSTRPGQWSAD